MQIDDDEEENSSTVKRKKIDISSTTKSIKAAKEKEMSPKYKKDILKSKDERRNSEDKAKESSSKPQVNTINSDATNGSGTLGRSRKKKAAPQPPTKQIPAHGPKNTSQDIDCSSSSSISKSSVKKASKKDKKHSSSSASTFAVTSSNSDDCPFLAFKVKVSIIM